MTDDDRMDIVDGILALTEKKVIITHGTDTMKQTALTLSDDTRLADKTIVLTGAMKPEKFRDSDADFNVGMAVGAVQCLPPGVYIALNGVVAPWNKQP